MKYLEKLMQMAVFSRKDVVELAGSESAAHSILYEYTKAGYIDRIRRDLYTAISFETKQSIANRFQIASNISEDSCIALHSAFEYYGFAYQVFHEIYVAAKTRFSNFNYDGIDYTRISPKISSGIVKTNSGIKVTSLERTVIDNIYFFNRYGGLEELIRCIMMIPSLKQDKLIQFLDEYNQSNLYQKTGYILSEFSKQLGIDKEFFDYCKSRVPQSKQYLYTEKDSLYKSFVLQEDWKLYAPESIITIIEKGAIHDT